MPGIAKARARLAGGIPIDEQHPASLAREGAGYPRTDDACTYDGDRFLLRHSANVCELRLLEKVRQRIQVVDSPTAGHPTRLVLEGGPPLGSGPLEERARRFRAEFDGWRSAIVNEPRGSDAMVGALLCAPHRQDCRFGVIFFNNVG